MQLEQFYLGCLAQASYLIGSGGVAVVIDPQRDVDQYLDFAVRHSLRIGHVIETHLHADFVSGHRELAERTGARIYLGEGSGATFPHCAVRDHDEISFGDCRLRFLQTPGHTIESVCVLITDLARSPQPSAVLTGDTLFIGDVGRPDLAESHTPEQLAALLYDSLHDKLLRLPDDVEVYPAHRAGSLCGRSISADRSSTIGRERQFNYALQPMSRDQFVRMLTQDLPTRPEYFQRDIDLNRRGAVPLADLPPLEPLSARATLDLQKAGATILDTRPHSDFFSAHVPGSLHIGLDGQFAAWAGSLLGLDRTLILLAADPHALQESQQRLARVGIERLAGFVDSGIAAFARSGLPLEPTPQRSTAELHAQLNTHSSTLPLLLDVRRPAEWIEGRIPSAAHLPLDTLPHRLAQLDSARPTAVYCKSGYRSAIACSLLQAAGFSRVFNIPGGFDAWSHSQFPIEQELAILNTAQ
jgi:hydroxyacylglutathione hydrolase